MLFPFFCGPGREKIFFLLLLLKIHTTSALESKGRIFHPHRFPFLSGGAVEVENFSNQTRSSISGLVMDSLSPSRPVIRVVFSDVDGTLVHYPAPPSSASASELNENNNESALLRLPPSSTGTRGIISYKTLQLCQRLRQMEVLSSTLEDEKSRKKHYVKFVLVSGMRTTTLFQRVSYLPFSDAYCCENGGRIFYPEPLSPDDSEEQGSYDKNGCYVFSPPSDESSLLLVGTNGRGNNFQRFRLVEDMAWRQKMSEQDLAGPDAFPTTYSASEMAIPVEQRKGKLWEFASQLKRRGWILDDRGYATCFRVHHKTQVVPNLDIDSDLKMIVPHGLVATENLGCVDVYPKSSGKKNA